MGSKLKLIIGDKNLSSWSMRAWLVMKASELAFEENLILLDQPDTKMLLEQASPSSRVPCLIHNDLKIWDSLAICEYLSDLAPEKNLWPQDKRQKAIARSYVAEMHSGFVSLRSQCSMDIRLKMEIRHLAPGTVDDIQRIIHLWKEALQNSGGPFLFAKFGIVDAFYAPVVFRFLSYGIQIDSELIRKYMTEIQNNIYVREWVAEAHKEKFTHYKFRD